MYTFFTVMPGNLPAKLVGGEVQVEGGFGLPGCYDYHFALPFGNTNGTTASAQNIFC